ncbi:NUDIX domain-containing protein [Streptomyces roseoverticillatus]|uniref:NUDIX domain-containing protein n=1 Tax=Streptomyces roseoverticillatus TaxID=66429 RepID=UPI001F488A02|nr:NUDIX domain-containing protein [Streptomyces roseoverticillatus]MCF3105359.1 NUDIX domain-containing protein [Streptomyces roseoverticillatus]
MSTEPHTTAPAGIVVRACAVILNDRHVCLIHRQRPDGDQYSLPGGLVHTDEEVPAALARELKEELDLDVTALPDRSELRWVQDQITSRPGSTTPFRRLHLIHVLHLPPYARQTVAAAEQDADDRTRIVWTHLDEAAHLHLYPAVGEALDGLTSAAGQAAPVLLPPMTDRDYRWR